MINHVFISFAAVQIHNMFIYSFVHVHILNHTMLEDQHNATHDGVTCGCNTVEYATTFLYSDWLHLPWHGINDLYTLIFCFISAISQNVEP